MSVITTMRNQTAVYWAPAAPDGFGGRAYLAPVQLECRWDGMQERFTDVDGDEVLSKGVVYPDRLLEINGYLKEGTLESATSDNPLEEDGAFEIRGRATTPNFKNTEVLYTVYIK